MNSETVSCESPRLLLLREALQHDRQETLEIFWREVEQKGTPLLEAAQEEGYSLLTFVWREQGETSNVVLIGGPLAGSDLSKGQMIHLEGTDVWYKTFRVRNDLRNVYQFSPNDSLVPLDEATDWKERTKTFLTDPLNPRIFTLQDPEDPELTGYRFSILELPDAPSQKWAQPDPNGTCGNVHMERFESSILGNTRRVWVYTPPNYSTEHEPYGLLLIFDGLMSIELIPTPVILDNLSAAGLLPPMVAVIPDSLLNSERFREMSLHEAFVDFLEQELLPWVHEHYHVSRDPARAIVSGSSLGGLAAAFVAFRKPELFGNVLSQSGSFWMGKEEEESEWLARQFALSPRVPVRFYLEVGTLESAAEMVATNRHLRNVLEAKGYEVHYSEFHGGHTHLCWRGSLAQGLLSLAGNTALE